MYPSILAPHLGDAGGGGSGTVTSVTASSPIKIDGSANVTPNVTFISTDSGNKFIGTPADGSAGIYTGRALVAADIPSLATSYIVNSTLAQASANFNIGANGVIGGTLAVTGTSIFTDRITANGGINASGSQTSSIASTANNVAGVQLNINGGTTETILIRSQQGTSATSVNIVSTAGGITLNSSSAVAITNAATVGGTFGVTGAATFSGSSTQNSTIINAVQSFTLNGGTQTIIAASGSTVSVSGSTVDSTIQLPAGAVAGTMLLLINSSTVSYTLDGNGGTIDGSATIATTAGVSRIVSCLGSNVWRSANFTKTQADTFYLALTGGTLSGLLTCSLGLTVTGAAVNLNTSSNFAVNIGTGTNNALVTIGGGSGTFALSTASGMSVTAAGAVTGVTTVNASGLVTCVGVTTSGAITSSASGAASAPAITFTGTVTTGTSTTAKPYCLFEPTGTTSTNWSTSGTVIGINAASGYVGDLVNFQTNNVSKFKINSVGLITCVGGATINGNTINLNVSSNQPTNIGSGTSNGLVTIGGGSGTVAISTTSWAVTSAGAASGFTTIAASGTIYSSAGTVGGAKFALTDGATIALDLSKGNMYTVTLGGNRTLSNPTNGIAGTSYKLRVKQDGTGSRTLAFDTQYDLGGQTYTLTGTANKIQEFWLECVDSTHFSVLGLSTGEFTA